MNHSDSKKRIFSLTINGTTHTYDQKNQLTSLSGLDSSGAWVTVSYRYDPMGRRISSSLNNQMTLYAYDGWNVVEEYQLQPSSFILQTLHTWGLDLSGTIQGAGGVGGLLYTEDLSSGTAWHHHYDGNGNVTHLTDASATSIASYTYDAFGNTETTTGSAASANKYRFSTKPIEDAIPSNPLYYYGYRFYNPITGRWPSRDPIEEQGGLNLYGFVNNDGVNFIDKLGQKLSKVNASDVKIELKAKPVPHSGGSEGGAVTASFDSQASGSGTAVWFTIKLPGKLEISGWAYSDEDGAMAHEENHVKLFVEDWNTFVDEVNWTEKTFCRCGPETLDWVETRQHLRFLESYKRNLDFDKTDYTARGVAPISIAVLDRKIATNNGDLATAKIADDAATKARTDCEKKAGY